MRYPTFIISKLGFLFLYSAVHMGIIITKPSKKEHQLYLGGDFPLAYSSTILSMAKPAVCGYYTHITTGLCMTGNVRIFWRDWKMDWTLNSQTDRSQSKSEHIFLKKENLKITDTQLVFVPSATHNYLLRRREREMMDGCWHPFSLSPVFL